MIDFAAEAEALPAPSDTNKTPSVSSSIAPQNNNVDFAAEASAIPSPEEIANSTQVKAQAQNAAQMFTDPDITAKAADLGKPLGLPAAAVWPNMEQFLAQDQLNKNNQIVKDNPNMAEWAVDHSEAAQIARDDFDGLSVFGKIAKTFSGANVPVMGQQLARAESDEDINGGLGLDTTQQQQDITNLKAGLADYAKYQPTGIYAKTSWWLNQGAGLLDNILNALPEMGSGAIAGAIAGAPEGGVGAIPGMFAGGAVGLKIGLAGDWARIAHGEALEQLSNYRDRNGQPMNNIGIQTGAALTAALTGAIGLYGAPAQGAVVKDTLSLMVGDAVKQALEKPTTSIALQTVAKNAALGSGEMGAIMGGMTLASQIGMEMGKQISPGDWNTVANDPKIRDEYVSQLAGSIGNGMLVGSMLHGLGSAIGEYGNFKQSETMQQQFAILMDNSVDSKTRARSPDAFQTFAQSQLNNTAAENVYLPADKIQALYDRAKVAPGAEDGILGKAAPDIADQLKQAAEVNGDIVIPAADYAAYIAGTKMDATLRPDLRVTQDGMSLNQLAEFKDKYQDVISKIGDTIKAEQDSPTTKIYQDVQQKIQPLGFNDSYNHAVASVMAAKYTTRANSFGIDPLEMYRQQGIQFRRGEPGELPSAALDAFPAKQVKNAVTLDDMEKNSRAQIVGENRPVSELLDFLKGEKNLPRDKQQMTLTGFLKKNGGIQDEGGELAGMDANKQVKGLVRKTGMLHDDAALKAWEAGYIGKPDGERPSIDELLQAIRRDLQKRDVFSGNEDLLDKGTHAQANDLSRILDEHEIPYEGRETPDILRDMRDAALLPEHLQDRGESAEPIASSIDTPEFKQWFGDSKVVDKDGNPQVVYHGTTKEFSSFDTLGGWSPGAWFAVDKGKIKDFGDKELPVYLNIENPGNALDLAKARQKIAADGIDGMKDRREFNDAVIKQMQSQGFDGIHAENFNGAGGKEVWVAFHPEQIKSVNNEGGFDSRNSNIFKQGDRATLTIAEGQHIITLFEGADKSSVLHELGHIWLTELQADASRSDAPEQLKKDWQTIKTAIGHDEGSIKEESHETFARMTEQYLMEGKAPSQSLRQAFRSFKTWMNAIYRTVKNLNVPMTDDVRGVFDRMLGTDDEITQMEMRQQVNRLFKTKEEAGMTDAEFAAYNKSAINAQQSAREELLTQAMEEVRKKAGKEWNKAAAEIKPGIADAIKNRQDIRALEWFKTGKLSDGTGNEIDMPVVAIDKAALEQVSPGASKEMPRGVPVEEDGAHPDEIAPLLGYNTGADMINDLRELGKTEKNAGRQQVANYLTDQVVNSRLQQKFGVTDDQLRERAEELMGSPDRLDLKLAELRALGRKTGSPVMFTKENIGAWADDHIANMKAADAANSYQFVRAVAKSGREAVRLLAKGDDKGAMDALQRQALNMALADRAKAVEKDYASGNRFFKYAAGKATIKSTDQAYLNQVHALLSQLGFRVRRDPVELRNSLDGKSLNDFVNEKTADGYNIQVPDFLTDGSKIPFKDMTTEQFAALHDAVSSMLHNGREEQSIISSNRKIAREALRQEIIDQRRAGESINLESVLKQTSESKVKTAKSVGSSIMSAIRRIEDMVQALDNDNKLGPYFRSFFQPLSEAADREDVMKKAEAKAFSDMRRALPEKFDKFLKSRATNDELIDPRTNSPHEFSGGNLIMIALNTGNKSNLDKMLRGEKWTKDQVMSTLDRNFTKEHWDSVQGILDRLENYWEPTEQLYRRTSGIAPTKIEATAINTKFGDYRGGYFPVKYDPIRSAEFMGKIGGADIPEGSPLGNSFMSGLTSDKRTISRTNVAFPLSYDINLISKIFNDTIHDIAFREAIINANKFLKDKTIINEIQQRAGKDVYQQLTGYVQDIAQPFARKDFTLSGADRVLSALRSNIITNGVAFRISTILKHTSSAAMHSIGEDSGKFLGGLKEFISSPQDAIQKCYDKSSFMKLRTDQIDRDMVQPLALIKGENSIGYLARAAGHYGIGLFDQASAVPTWIGHYNDAMVKGFSDNDAVTLADQAVRDAHGASRSVDLPAYLRTKNEWMRLFTPFAGFTNHMYQRGILRTGRELRYASESFHQGESAEALQHVGSAMARMFWYYVVPGTLISSLINPKGEDFVSRTLKGITNEAFAGLPFVNSIVSAITEGRQASFTAASRAFDNIYNTGKNLASEVGLRHQAPSNKALQQGLDTAGIVTGLPVGGQPAEVAQFVYNVNKGIDHPHSLSDYAHGVMYGTSKEKPTH